MCGILGSINIVGTAQFLDEIRHRGPDASGAESYTVGDHSVSLLHRRLSIVDLSEAGSQPMASADTIGQIVFNGEIYNHSELKEQLSDIAFKGHSDTESMVNHFRKFSMDDALCDLNGIFGIAYLDLETKKLYLARDRFGIKPLYYFFDGTRLMFSSEIRPLKACLTPPIDEGVVLNSQRMRYTPSPLTMYRTIKKVEPGQLITFDLTAPTIRVQKKYFVKNTALGGRKGEMKKIVNTYGDLFEKAVERQLMADVDVGILLSGGVDSALVAAIASQKSSKKIKAFTIGFEGDHSELDEIGYAEETAATLGLEHHIKKIAVTDFLGAIQKIATVVEEPIATTSIIPMFFLSELAASQVKVVLSGQGADEPLGGYYKYKAVPLLEKVRRLGNFNSLIESLGFIYKGNENLRRVFKAVQPKDNIRSWMAYNAVSSFGEIEALLRPEFVTSGMKSLHEHQDTIYNTWKSRSDDKNSLTDLFLYCDMRSSLSDDLLMYTDKITMHYGLECRVPILDNDLMEFVESLDKSYKFNTKGGKIIHKAFAEAYLPSTIIHRKKLNFRSPTDTWFREKMDELIQIFEQEGNFQEIFDITKIKALLQRHKNGKNLEKQIFLLLSLHALIR